MAVRKKFDLVFFSLKNTPLTVTLSYTVQGVVMQHLSEKYSIGVEH
jgi:hypothetical protein